MPPAIACAACKLERYHLQHGRSAACPPGSIPSRRRPARSPTTGGQRSYAPLDVRYPRRRPDREGALALTLSFEQGEHLLSPAAVSWLADSRSTRMR